jgi:hypothetical protein
LDGCLQTNVGDVHHMYARLPQLALPDFTGLLEPTTSEDVAPYSSYYRALCDMVGSLGNPRIGAQWDHK